MPGGTNVGSVIVDITLNMSQFNSGLNSARSSLNSFATKATLGLAGLGTAMTYFVTRPIVDGFKEIISEGINFNATLEMLQVGLTNTMGDAKMAADFIEQLKGYSAATPFNFEDMAEMARMMQAMGVSSEDLFGNIQILGDQLAYIGRTGSESWFRLTLAMSQIRNKASLMQQDLNQLSELGINPYEMIAKGLGVSVEKARELKETLTGQEAYDALMKGMQMTSEGAAKEMGATWSSLVQNIGEKTKFMLSDMLKPVFEDLKPRLENLMNMMETFKGSPEFQEWAQAVRNIFNEIAEKALVVAGIIQQIGDTINNSGVEGKENFIKSIGALAAIGPALLVISSIVGTISEAVNTLSLAWMAWTATATEGAASGAIVTGLGSIASTVAIVVGVIAAAGVALYQFWNENEEFRTTCEDVWNDISQIVESVASNIMAVWEEIGPGIMDALETLWDGFVSIIGGLAEIVVNVVGLIADIMTGDFAGALEHLSGIGTGIVDVLSGLFWAAIGIVETALGVIIGLAAAIVGGVIGAFSGLIDQGVAQWGIMIDTIYAFLTSSVPTFIQAGMDLVAGLLSGMESGAESLYAWASNIATGIADTIKSALVIQSPSRVMKEIGVNIVQGLAQGLYDEAPEVDDAAKELADKIARAVGDLKNNLDRVLQDLDWGLEDALAVKDIELAYLDLDTSLDELQKSEKQTQIETQKLTSEYEYNQAKLDELNAALETQIQLNGEGSDEAKDYTQQIKELSRAQEQLSIDTQLANLQLRKQYQEIVQENIEFAEDMAEEIEEIEKDKNEALLEAQEEYSQNVIDRLKDLEEEQIEIQKDYANEASNIINQMNEDLLSAQDEFNKAFADKVADMTNWTGLFDDYSGDEINGTQLLNNLKESTSVFSGWTDNIQELTARGLDEGLVNEIRLMGPSAAAQVQAMTQLSDEKLQEYVALWKLRQEQAKAEVTVTMENQRQEMLAKQSQIRMDAQNQLELQRQELQQKLNQMQQLAEQELEKYKQDWKKQVKEINKNSSEQMADIQSKFNKMIRDATNWGRSLWSNFDVGSLLGYNTSKNALQRQLDNLARMASSTSSGKLPYVGAYAEGGFVPSTGIALLHAGEYVLNSDMVRALSFLVNRAASIGSLNPNLAVAGAGAVNNINITVNGADDPSSVAAYIMDQLNRAGVKF